jgi:hypothetical protein
MADIVYPGSPPDAALNFGALPRNTDLVVYKGDYVEFFVTIKDEYGVPIFLDNKVPKAQLKNDYDDDAPVDFTCQVIETQVRIYLPSDVSQTIPAGDYIWDFQLTDDTGQTRTYLAGDVVIYNEVTQ